MRFHADPLIDEIRHLREQLEAADKRNGELAAENAVLRDRIDEMVIRQANERARVEGELRDYEQSMARANLEIIRLRGEVADLQRQVDEDEEQMSYLEDLRR